MAQPLENTHQARTTDADWADIRQATIAAHETPALFESVAELSNTDSDDHQDCETEEGTPVSAYGSPMSLWELKTGRYNDVGNGKRGLWSRIKWGVMAAAAEERGIETKRPDGVYIHPEYDFMSSRIDMDATEDGGATWIPMISFNVAGTLAETWRNATGDWTPPEQVQIQAQHHMAVSGTEKLFVVALFGGVSIRFFVIERDEELIEAVLDTVVGFWDAVQNDRRPKPSGARDADVMSRLYSKIDPKTEVIDMRGNAKFVEMVGLKARKASEKTALEKEIKALNAQLLEMMEGVGSAIIEDGRQLTWTHTEAGEVSYTRSASSRLIAKKISEKTAGTKLLDLLAG
jgi:predicted phage-related endonuclease